MGRTIYRASSKLLLTFQAFNPQKLVFNGNILPFVTRWLKTEATAQSLSSSSSSMETLSSSVSTLKVPTTLLSTPSREVLNYFKTPHDTHKLPPQTHLHKATTTAKTSSFNQKPLSLFTPSFSIPTRTLLTSPSLHRNPASGYAAALLDIAQCNRTLNLVHKDVKRFLQLLHNKQVQAVLRSPFVGLEEKGQVMKLVAQKGKFNKHLVNLVMMLVEKSKVGIVKEMLEEFGRIYSELSGANQGLLRVM